MDSGPETVVKSSSDLPPPRQRKALRPVSPPLSNVSLHRFNYYIAIAASLLFAIYAYRILQWKAEAGSWWNLALGRKPPAVQQMQDAGKANAGWTGSPPVVNAGGGGAGDVERRINELAAALGIPSKDLASAIAGAVREYVPPASLSSIAAHQTGYVTCLLLRLQSSSHVCRCREAVQYLVDPSGASQTHEQVGATATRAAEAVAAAFGAAVGMDEPPTEL